MYFCKKENHLNNQINKKLAFKNNASFKSSISKINNTFTYIAEDLDIVMMMYRLLEYSEIYLITLGSLWNYYVDEMHDDANENNVDNYRINNNRGVNL